MQSLNGIRLVADDLTGALECAALFASNRNPIPVFDSVKAGSFGVWPTVGVVNLNTRDLTATAAATSVKNLLEGHSFDGLWLHKIDSQMRGNIPAELAAFLASKRFKGLCVAPALPREMRVTIEGQQYDVRQSRRSPIGQNLIVALKEHGVFARIWASTMKDLYINECFVADATTDADLRNIARNWLGSEVRLISGSAGIIAAVAVYCGYKPEPICLTEPVELCFIGSRHEVVGAQVQKAREAGFEDTILDGSAPTNNAVLLLADPQAHDFFTAQHQFDQSIRKLAEVRSPPKYIFASGGDTLFHMTKTLDCECLLCRGEVLPGAPVSEMVGGIWSGTMVVSRSGGFGESGDILNLLCPIIPGNGRTSRNEVASQ